MFYDIQTYCFLTKNTTQQPIIWFYPLNTLEISGYELFVLVLLSPLLLKITFINSFLRSDTGHFVNQIVICGTLLSFRASTTLSRLIIVAIGCFFASLKLAIDVTQPDSSTNQRAPFRYVLGFVIFLVSRIPYKTIVPAFNDSNSNLAIFTICLSSLVIQSKIVIILLLCCWKDSCV